MSLSHCSFFGASRNMRPIFCGNLEFDARQSEVERLFRRYGKVERVDMKSGVRICLSTSLQFL